MHENRVFNEFQYKQATNLVLDTLTFLSKQKLADHGPFITDLGASQFARCRSSSYVVAGCALVAARWHIYCSNLRQWSVFWRFMTSTRQETLWKTTWSVNSAIHSNMEDMNPGDVKSPNTSTNLLVLHIFWSMQSFCDSDTKKNSVFCHIQALLGYKPLQMVEKPFYNTINMKTGVHEWQRARNEWRPARRAKNESATSANLADFWETGRPWNGFCDRFDWPRK